MVFFNDLRSERPRTRAHVPRTLLGEVQAEAQRAQHLTTHGRAGTATITALRQTGTFVNENPEVEMDLQVSVDGMPPYPATHRQVIATIAAPLLQPGTTVPVKVDPAEPTSLIVA